LRSLTRLIGVALATALGLAGCTSPTIRWDNGSDTASGPAVGTVPWRDCRSSAQELSSRALSRDLSYDCGTVTVPQNWLTAKDGKATDGKTFNLALIRIRAKNQHDRLGSLLTDPGGPGGSGIEFAVGRAPDMTDLLKRFDLIGFDPRGVGQSAAVDCFTDADLDAYFGADPDPRTDAEYTAVVAINRKLDAACTNKYGDALALYSTEQAVHDMDAIRVAVGDPKMTYLGFSYGTLLGAVYSKIFPRNIRALVLDGVVDPQQQPTPAAESQAKGFERTFAGFSDWCTKQTESTCPIKADPRGAVLTALNQARANPLKGQDGRRATSGWVLYAVVRAMYGQDAWPYLAKAIDNLSHGDPNLTFLLADDYAERVDGHYNNMFDAFTTISCTDYDQFPTLEAIRTLQSQWRAKYPIFGGALATGLIGCSVWAAKHDPYPVGPATGAPPIVLVGTTGDPATPYEQTARTAQELGNGTVITWQGQEHTAYFSSDCIRSAVDDYLIDLRQPATGLTCPP
jgi:pimeloyl-ACP methyl ester carboxylesterase